MKRKFEVFFLAQIIVSFLARVSNALDNVIPKITRICRKKTLSFISGFWSSRVIIPPVQVGRFIGQREHFMLLAERGDVIWQRVSNAITLYFLTNYLRKFKSLRKLDTQP
jgi:hypothetical protein